MCAGLDGVRGIGRNRWRAGFVLGALCGGIGIIAYLGCWLIIPDTEESADSETVRGVVLLAWGTGGLVAVVLTAGVSAVGTVFGLGWVVAVLAGIVLLLALTPIWKRVPAFVALLAVAALTLPAMAVALSSVRLSLQDGSTVSRPSSGAAIDSTVFHSGFGTQLIDLRQTSLPTAGTLTMRIDAGIRRTIVVLPTGTCVHVTVNYAIHPFASQLATLVSGHSVPPFHGVVLFGDVFGATPSRRDGTTRSAGTLLGPRLRIDFSSQGGSLYVRDYPDDVSASTEPNWPGFVVTPERRPNLEDEPRTARKLMLTEWRARRRTQIADRTFVDAQMAGPCAS